MFYLESTNRVAFLVLNVKLIVMHHQDKKVINIFYGNKDAYCAQLIIGK